MLDRTIEFIVENRDAILIGVVSGLVVAFILWLLGRLRRQPPAPPLAPAQDQLYDICTTEELFDIIAKPGETKPNHVERPEMADLYTAECQLLLISGEPQTGKTFEAYHAVTNIRRSYGLGNLTVLVPKSTVSVPDGPPPGCSGDVVIFIDNLHSFDARQKNIQRALADIAQQFAGWFPGHHFCIVATTETSHADTLVRSLEFAPDAITHVTLPRLSGHLEAQVLYALGAAFGLKVSPTVMDALAAANDGTVVAAYDLFRERAASGAKAMRNKDAQELGKRVRKRWQDIVGRSLSRPEKRAIGLLSTMRACGIPLYPWIIEYLARQRVSETTLGLIGWQFLKGPALRTAMDKLAKTWIPRSPEGEFTPHDSRLQLERGNIIEDAYLVARALARLCDDRPVRAGLRDAYAGLESIFYTQERYDLLLPLLRAWTRTSIQPGKEDPALSDLIAQLQPDAQPPPPDRAENLQQVIAYCEAALRVWTEKAFPTDWAGTQNNLGNAYVALPTGDRAQNLHQAIACYEAALRVHSEDAFPTDWAMTQNNLGNVYSQLPSGDRGQNLQQAIGCYQAALRVLTEDAFPVQWAGTQNNLGAAYPQLPTGDRAENLHQAIACYQAALRVCTEDAFPVRWAGTQTNLGNAYRNLRTGERGENLQRAMACCEAALQVRTQDAFPVEWAETMYNLGLLYLAPDFPGDRAKNAREAVKCFEAALRVWTQKAFPADHAKATAALEDARAATGEA